SLTTCALHKRRKFRFSPSRRAYDANDTALTSISGAGSMPCEIRIFQHTGLSRLPDSLDGAWLQPCRQNAPHKRLLAAECRPLRHQFQKVLVNATVVAQFRMERCRQCLARAYQLGIFAFGRDHFHALAHTFYLGCADEDHLDGMVQESPFADGAVNLAAVGVAPHGDVERTQARLLRIFYFRGEQDASRAGAEGWLRAYEIFQLRQAVFPEQFEKCPRLASGNYQAVEVIQLLRLFHQDNFRAQLFEPAAMRVEIALQG